MAINKGSLILGIATVLLLVHGCHKSVAPPNPETMKLNNTHLQLFAEWIERSWDNIKQVEKEIDNGMPEHERHHRYATRYTEVTIPALSGRTFAIENYDDGQGLNGEMQRVSLHRFMLSDESNSIVHEIILIKDPVFRSRLKNDLSQLENITPADIKVNKNCRLYWRWTGTRFEGATKNGACITNSYSDRKILVEGSGILEQNQLFRHDRNYEMTGEEIIRPGHQSGEVFLPISQIN